MPLGSAADVRPSVPPCRIARSLAVLAIMAVFLQGGCTALLSTTALRDAIPGASDATDEATLDEPIADAAGDTAADEEPIVLVKPAVSAEQTIDEAIERLAAAGRLDEATQAALITMLESAPQEDWPAIIDAFIESLEASHVAAKPVAPPTPMPAPPAVPAAAPAPAEPPPAAVAPAVVIDPAPPAAAPATPPAEPLVFPVIEPVTAIEPITTLKPITALKSGPEPAPASLGIANACFASRVRGWGQVDRFETSQFRAGQDVILYFELEDLASRETNDGHRTEVDTALRLVTDNGRTLHEWSFAPVEETCPTRRRDYFIRYVLRLPAGLAPGNCRLDVAATDAVGDRTATASLPLEIVTR